LILSKLTVNGDGKRRNKTSTEIVDFSNGVVLLQHIDRTVRA